MGGSELQTAYGHLCKLGNRVRQGSAESGVTFTLYNRLDRDVLNIRGEQTQM